MPYNPGPLGGAPLGGEVTPDSKPRIPGVHASARPRTRNPVNAPRTFGGKVVVRTTPVPTSFQTSDSLSISDSAHAPGPGHASDAITVTDAVTSTVSVAALSSLYKRIPGVGSRAAPRTRNPVNAPRYFHKVLPKPPASWTYQPPETAISVSDAAHASSQPGRASDALTISDTALLGKPTADSLSVSDSATAVITGRVGSDSISVSDALNVVAQPGHASDSISISDAATRNAFSFSKSASDALLYITDHGYIGLAGQGDTIVVGEILWIGERIAVNDTATLSAIHTHASTSDSITVSEVLRFGLQSADLIAVTDAITYLNGQTVYDTLSVSDSARGLVPQAHVVDSTIHISESAYLAFHATAADSLTYIVDTAIAFEFFLATDSISIGESRTTGFANHGYAFDHITITDVAPALGFDVIVITDSATGFGPFKSGLDVIVISDVASAEATSDGFVYQAAIEVAFVPSTEATVYTAGAEVGFVPTSEAIIYEYAAEVAFAPVAEAIVYEYAAEIALWNATKATETPAVAWPHVPVFFDRMASRLSVQVETGDGNRYRWAQDAWDPQDVFQDLNFSTVMPGGFEQLSLTLNRDPKLEWHDLEAFAKVTVYAPGGRIVWQGRLEEFPASAGDQAQVSVRAVGGQAYLDDNDSAAMIYIDQNLTSWGGPGVQRQVTLANFISLSTATPWSAGLAVAPGLIMTPGNGYFYYSVQWASGVTGGVMPTWPTTPGQTVVDGTVVWDCLGTAPAPTNLSPPTGIAWQQAGTSVSPDPSGAPALIAQINDTWTAPSLPLVEGWYDAQAIGGIAKLYYSFKYPNFGKDVISFGINSDASWGLTFGLSVDNNASVHLEQTGWGPLYGSTMPASGAGYWEPGGSYDYAFFDWYNNPAVVSGATSNGEDGGLYWNYLRFALYGPHGLPLYGPDPAGVLASDVIAHAIRTWAPELTYTTGSQGSIQPSVYVIPQLVFQVGTPSQIVKGAVVFEMLDWAVWENFTFFLNARGARGKKWRVQSGPAHLQAAGPQVSKIWNGVIVQFTGADGVQYTVGPPGSGATRESALLVDTNAANPANKAGLKKWTTVQMGTSDFGPAIATGQIFLQETNRLNTSGSATITGYIQDTEGVFWPAWMVRAGDQIAFIDAFDASYRRVVHTQYTAIDAKNVLQLDQPPDTLEALLQRLSLSIVGFGLS